MEQKKILVVEDEKSLLKAIKLKMEQNDFDVVTARSSEEAQSILENEENEIDVIWLDHYLLGKEDGLGFLAKIKNSNVWENIPVFVVSNTATPEKMQTYISFGADKYYTKSDYRLDEIIEDIKTNLDN